MNIAKTILNTLTEKNKVVTVSIQIDMPWNNRSKQYRKDNWRRWQKTGKEWNKIQKEHRAYKQKLYEEGELRL